nr:er degradation-enhancing alpha-mannosidase-like protein 1 [Quercus suber]
MLQIAWPSLMGLVFVLLLTAVWVPAVIGMTDDELSGLRDDTRHLFYHGFESYIANAFPEDELKPISCLPQTRNQDEPSDIGLNDVLGNYSVTLIDSLSTLAILASDPEHGSRRDALLQFQSSIKSLVELYGDGTQEGRCGTRACGFDLDSKVQVFETNIRGVGGLLSAHLFATGDLPIDGYEPAQPVQVNGETSIDWNGWTYNGQLLRLAHDLASRLLPAFAPATGLPYPRVNLRTGIPFYRDAEQGVCRVDGTSSHPQEITETCTAGAGSLVLEFTTLSRLTGDGRFETLAKRAFWAVWQRRSPIGLLASGLDAESGQWITPPLAGIGAGIDSFYEYAMKSHILISGLPPSETPEYDDPQDFLLAWQQAHSAVKRHIYRSASSQKHAFYAQADPFTGAPRYSWIDNLSAYYPGLLTLAGELDEAIESHLLYAALWTKYSALPERIHILNAFIDANFRHWAGRPEFIESTYYIYQATKDPWYLHVGEMALRDIRRRCWTPCGWADLTDVISGEKRDRMESFFLGETAKYLYLLFTPQHPLNRLDGPVVFTTEGHPLVIPASYRRRAGKEQKVHHGKPVATAAASCPKPAAPIPFTISNTANRSDIFHASALAQLHSTSMHPAHQYASSLQPASADGPGVSIRDIRSPTNYTFYPWTLPQSLIPDAGWSQAIYSPVMSTLTFPSFHGEGKASGGIGSDKGLMPFGALQKVVDGILVNSLSNLRLNMIQESKSQLIPDSSGVLVPIDAGSEYRIHGIANWALGKDEKVLLSAQALGGVSPSDPHFSKVKDLEMIDLVVEVTPKGQVEPTSNLVPERDTNDDDDFYDESLIHDDLFKDEGVLDNGALGVINEDVDGLWEDIEALFVSLLRSAKSTITSALPRRTPMPANAITNPSERHLSPHKALRYSLPAILPTGPGTAPLASSLEANDPVSQLPIGTAHIYFLDDELCDHHLPMQIPRTYSVLMILRGKCSFADKLANIPAFPPSVPSASGTLGSTLQMVIIVDMLHPSFDDDYDAESFTAGRTQRHEKQLIRPLLDRVQLTPSGLERREGIAMCMVDGTAMAAPSGNVAEGDSASRQLTIDLLRSAAAVIGGFDEYGELVEERKAEHQDLARLGVKRRFWFESLGVPIGNLVML